MNVVSKRLTFFWLLLVGITFLSFESSMVGAKIAGQIVVGIGLIKVLVVGREFMELRAAPLLLQAVFYAWLAILSVVLLAMIQILR